jgi:hypothetical protein
MQNVLKLTFLVIALGLHGCEERNAVEQGAFDITDGKSDKLLKDTGVKQSETQKVESAVKDAGTEVVNSGIEAQNKLAEAFGADKTTYKYKNWRNGGENIKIFFKNAKIHLDNCMKGTRKQAVNANSKLKKNLK